MKILLVKIFDGKKKRRALIKQTQTHTSIIKSIAWKNVKLIQRVLLFSNIEITLKNNVKLCVSLFFSLLKSVRLVGNAMSERNIIRKRKEIEKKEERIRG